MVYQMYCQMIMFLLKVDDKELLSKKKLNNWVNDVFFYTNFIEEEEKNYNRNRKLIDLSSIPQEIEDKINNEFNDVKVASRDKILGYFINKKLKTLIEVIDEFLDFERTVKEKQMVIIRRNPDQSSPKKVVLI